MGKKPISDGRTVKLRLAAQMAKMGGDKECTRNFCGRKRPVVRLKRMSEDNINLANG